jgi:hypothetical protein
MNKKHKYQEGDPVGQVFYVGEAESLPGKRNCILKCKCGKEFIGRLYFYTSEQHKSCGCRINSKSKIHSKTKTVEFETWTSMKKRCYGTWHKAYHNYGGRGITVCDRWLEKNGRGFLNFLEDMGPRPDPEYSLDRINNDGNYEPGNVKWSTKKEQSNNRRVSHFLTFNGISKTIMEWARELNIAETTIHNRLKRGLSVEETLITPIKTEMSCTIEGENKTLSEWVEIYNISKDNVYNRLQKGWDLEKSIVTPMRKYKKNNKKVE